MKVIFFLLRSSPYITLIAIIAGLIAGLSSTGLLALINSGLGTSGSRISIIWGFVGLCLVTLFSRVISQTFLIRLSVNTMFNMRMRLSRNILSVSLRHLEEIGPHRLLASMTEDLPQIGIALTTLPVLCMHAAFIVSCLVYLAWLSWMVMLGVLAFFVLAVASYQIPIAAALRYQSRAREDADTLFKHFRAMTEGTKELKLHSRRREMFLTRVLQATAVSLRRNQAVGNMVYAVASSWGQILIFALIGALLFAVPRVEGINNKTLTGYTILILYMMTPIEVIVNSLPVLGRANVALQKVEKLGLSLAANSTDIQPSVQPEREAGWRTLELKGVTHTYYLEQEDSSFTLGPLDLTFRPGELVFLTGGNGSGKTTVAKLITGLYVPESGDIILDGEPINEHNREMYRQYFSAVFSDFYLFESLLGLDPVNLDAKACGYLIKLHLEYKLRVENGVLSTIDISQGQRKRLALLTAYLEDRPIYLFDEWAADQDPYFKDVFYLQILPELKAQGKTVIVISHDDRYYHIAERVIKLYEGRIEYDKRMEPSMTSPATVS